MSRWRLFNAQVRSRIFLVIPYRNVVLRENKTKKKREEKTPERRKMMYSSVYARVWEIVLHLCWISGTYIPDRSDTPCIMLHRTGLECSLVGVLDSSLMMSGWLINSELTSLYLIYCTHHINPSYRAHI